MLSDCHMHTGFSLDSDANPEDMIESALAKGLDAVCFTALAIVEGLKEEEI